MASNLTSFYNFKEITCVPTAKDFMDIVLSKTQRKTPTEVHKQFKISRIRSFYMRKVKFCQQAIHDKLTDILTQFPKLDDIHPFYSDLCNVLYDRDHYKLALGQANAVRGVVDNVAKDYVRMMKYSDSLYKCKMLKRAALGRMCTALKKLQQSFIYLEEVRQHLARLPSINPHTRTLLLAGYPNVGKSSFINSVSEAKVEVQPYAFTTKSLFVGHFDYSYSRWQVIDTPGILDRPLEERNTIEMTAITALAHMQATVIYIVDISEQCGYTIDKQVSLFQKIKPLFANKSLLIILNKTDVRAFDSLSEAERDLIKGMRTEGDTQPIEFFLTSTLTTEGVEQAKARACDILLEQRINKKTQGKKVDGILTRLYVAYPKENKVSARPPVLPGAVMERKSNQEDRPVVETERELEEANGGAGIYSVDSRKKYTLLNDEWKHDIIPEIYNGRNVADFIDPDIERKFKELEAEEEELVKLDAEENFLDPEWFEIEKITRKLHSKIQLNRVKARLAKSGNKAPIPRSRLTKGLSAATKHLSSIGYDTSDMEKRVAEKGSRKDTFLRMSAMLRSREEKAALGNANKSDVISDYDNKDLKLSKVSNMKEIGCSSIKKGWRSTSSMPSNYRLSAGIKSKTLQMKAIKLKRRSDAKRNRKGMKGEGDRFIGTAKPKHLFSGKRGNGKTDRR